MAKQKNTSFFSSSVSRTVWFQHFATNLLIILPVTLPLDKFVCTNSKDLQETQKNWKQGGSGKIEERLFLSEQFN